MRKVVLSLALCLAMLVSSAQLGLAASAMTIRGFVRDAAGSPIEKARVSDGLGKIDYTDSNGFYTIEEEFPQDYRITVSKTGIVSQTRIVSVLDSVNDVNFEVRYVITTAISKPAVTTAGAAAETIYTVTSYARYPGSCVSVTDSRTSSTSAADFISYDSLSGISIWRKTLALPAQSSEGTFTLSAVAESCSSGTDLSIIPSPIQYMIDNTAPVIPLGRLFPFAGTQTIYAQQPLSASVTDNLSGIQAGDVSFTLRDVTANTTITQSATSITGDVAKTSDVTLISGHQYAFSVTASDRAGNTRSVTQGDALISSWLAISVSGVVSATIPRAEDPVITSDPVNGYRATFTNANVRVGDSTLSFSATAYGGSGVERIDVPLGSAQVCNNGPVPDCRLAGLTNKLVTTPFEVAASPSSPVSSLIPAHETSLGTVTVSIPVTHTDPYLVMDAVTVHPTFGTCKAPVSPEGSVGCSTDPLLASLRSVSRLEGEVTQSDPFTFQVLERGATVDISFEETSTTHFRSEVRASGGPFASAINWTIDVTNDGLGTATAVVTDNATGDTLTYNYATSSNGTCWKCDAAWFAAGAAAAAGYAWGGPIAGAIIGGAAAAAANHYCSTNPCQTDGAPSCTPRTQVYKSGDPYWQIYNDNWVSCTKTMNSLQTKTQLFQDNVLKFDRPTSAVFNRSYIDDSWMSHFDPVAPHCYHATLRWYGVWRDPVTQQNYYYGNWDDANPMKSNTICF